MQVAATVPDAGSSAPHPDPLPAVAGRGEVRPITRATRFELSAGAAAWVPALTVVRPAIVLDAAVHLAPAWRVGLFGAFSFEERHPVTVDGVDRGTLTTQAFLADVSGARCLGTTWRFCGGVLAGVRFARGSSQGDFLFHTGSLWLLRPSVGLSATLAVIPLRAVLVSLDLAGLVNPVPAEFTVTGIPSASQPFPVVEGLLRLSLGWGVDL